MIITRRVLKIGDSIGIIIDKPVAENLKLKEKDLVEIEIKKVIRSDLK